MNKIEKDLNAAFTFVLKSAKVDNAGELNEAVMDFGNRTWNFVDLQLEKLTGYRRIAFRANRIS